MRARLARRHHSLRQLPLSLCVVFISVSFLCKESTHKLHWLADTHTHIHKERTLADLMSRPSAFGPVDGATRPPPPQCALVIEQCSRAMDMDRSVMLYICYKGCSQKSTIFLGDGWWHRRTLYGCAKTKENLLFFYIESKSWNSWGLSAHLWIFYFYGLLYLTKD